MPQLQSLELAYNFGSVFLVNHIQILNRAYTNRRARHSQTIFQILHQALCHRSIRVLLLCEKFAAQAQNF
jgi:hypothetical protein